MDAVTTLVTFAFYAFCVIAAIRILVSVWNLKEREERIIEQNEKQLDLLERIAGTASHAEANPKDRD